MRVAISGSSGLIGTALTGSLVADDHEVVRLVRRPASEPGEVSWEPDSSKLDPSVLEDFDVVVNFNGASIGGRRWTSGYKKQILSSRINATRTLAETIAELQRPPTLFISASAIGYYGLNLGSKVLDEDDLPGTGFLARVAEYWEDAAIPAAEAGVSVANPRFGHVMSAKGGALARMLPWFRLGLGGPLAGGDHYWSSISLVDTVRALRFLINTPGCTGPYNVVAPEPVTNAEFSRLLADALNRPALFPVPAIALQIRFGELAENIAASHRAVPRRLLDAGFRFDHPTARAIVAAALR
jgi:uncharacterized protein (TIGR01777 family)